MSTRLNRTYVNKTGRCRLKDGDSNIKKLFNLIASNYIDANRSIEKRFKKITMATNNVKNPTSYRGATETLIFIKTCMKINSLSQPFKLVKNNLFKILTLTFTLCRFLPTRGEEVRGESLPLVENVLILLHLEKSPQ